MNDTVTTKLSPKGQVVTFKTLERALVVLQERFAP